MHDEIIGGWSAIKRRWGQSAPYLDVTKETLEEYVFRGDGVATMRLTSPAGIDESDVAWRIEDDEIVLELVVEPSVDSGVEYERIEEVRWQILAVGENRLILDSRPFGGEVITMFERLS